MPRCAKSLRPSTNCRCVYDAKIENIINGNEEIRQTLEHVVRSKPPGIDDRKPAARELVEHEEHAEGTSVPACCPEQSRTTTRGSAALVSDGRTIRRSTTHGCLIGGFQRFPTPGCDRRV